MANPDSYPARENVPPPHQFPDLPALGDITPENATTYDQIDLMATHYKSHIFNAVVGQLTPNRFLTPDITTETDGSLQDLYDIYSELEFIAADTPSEDTETLQELFRAYGALFTIEVMAMELAQPGESLKDEQQLHILREPYLTHQDKTTLFTACGQFLEGEGLNLSNPTDVFKLSDEVPRSENELAIITPKLHKFRSDFDAVFLRPDISPDNLEYTELRANAACDIHIDHSVGDLNDRQLKKSLESLGIRPREFSTFLSLKLAESDYLPPDQNHGGLLN